MKTEPAHRVDIHVGTRIRLRRKELGISQEVLAQALGLTFQQVQKYERGSNRVSASKLFDTARALHVHPGFFFDGLENGGEAETGRGSAGGQIEAIQQFLLSTHGHRIAGAFMKIRNTATRNQLASMVEELAAEYEAGGTRVELRVDE